MSKFPDMAVPCPYNGLDMAGKFVDGAVIFFGHNGHIPVGTWHCHVQIPAYDGQFPVGTWHFHVQIPGHGTAMSLQRFGHGGQISGWGGHFLDITVIFP